MHVEKPSAHDILAGFVSDIRSGKLKSDGQLEAVLLEHLLLQSGYKILPREPDEIVLLAGANAREPAEIWHTMWDATDLCNPDLTENYTPA